MNGTSRLRGRVPRKTSPGIKSWSIAGAHETYVAERHLERDDSGEPIVHRAIDYVFERFENGVYVPRVRVN